MSEVSLEDFNLVARRERESWDEHFADWCKTNAILVKYMYNELSAEDAEVVEQVLEQSPKYKLALDALELDPYRLKYNSEVFTKITEQAYKLVFRNFHQRLDNS